MVEPSFLYFGETKTSQNIDGETKRLVFSDEERFAQSQISRVVFVCNYLGFNVLGVAMAHYEVFFSDELWLVKCSFTRSCRNRVVLPM